MAIQQNPNWPVLFVKGIGAMAVSDGTNVLGINADGSINISGTIVTTPTSPQVIAGDATVHGTIDVQDRVARQLGHVLIDSQNDLPNNALRVNVVAGGAGGGAVTQATSPWVMAGDATVHGTVDVQDRVARQLGHVLVDSSSANPVSVTFAPSSTQAVTQSTSPWVVAGDVTIHGTTDVQDRVARQLGHVIVDSQPALTLSSPTVVAGDVTIHGTADIIDRAMRQLGLVAFTVPQHVVVDSQPAFSLSSPTVIVGDVTTHGTTDVQDRVARQLGHVIVDSQPAQTITLSSPTVIAGDVTVHGTVDVQDRAARQLGNLTSPIVIGILPSINIGATGGLALDSTLTGGQQKTLVTNFPATQLVSGTISLSSPAVVAGDVTVHGTVDVQDRASRQIGLVTAQQLTGLNLHVNIDNSPAVSQLASSSPWVMGGTVTTQGTTDVQDRIARQLGHVIVDSQPPFSLSSPTVVAGDVTVHGTVDVQDRITRQLGHVLLDSSPVIIGGDVTIHGLVDMQDRVARQMGHVIVDSQPPFSLSSPTVIAGDATVHGIIDVQDRGARQLGHVLIDNPAANPVQVSFVPSSTQAVTQSTSPWVIAGDVTIHGTTDVQDRVARQLGHVIVDSQPAFTLASPSIIGGDVTVHGTIDMQDRVARQVGHVLIDSSSANPVSVTFAPSSTQAVTQSTSPWVIAGDANIHGTVDVQDRVVRQLGHVIVDSQPALTLSSPTVVAGDVTVHGLVDVQDRVSRQIGHVIVDSQPALTLSSPTVVAGDVTVHGTTDIQDRVARQLGIVTAQQLTGLNLHVNIDNSPAVGQLASSSPWVVTGNVDASGSQVIIRSGIVSIQGTVPIAGTVPVSQPSGSSPWVVGGTVTTQGTTDIQDRAARQLGNLTSPVVIGILPSINIGSTGGLALDSTLTGGQQKTIVSGFSAGVSVPVIQASVSSPWVVAGDVTVHGTADIQDRVARQLGHVLLDSSPVIIGGDVTVHGTTDVQDRVARQLGHVLIDSSSANPVSVTFAPSSTQAVTQSTSPWVIAGDATVHGTVDVQDRIVRQLGHVIVDSQPALSLSSPTVVAGDVTVHGTVDVQDRAARQLGIVTSRQDVLSSPWVIAGNIVSSVSHTATDVSSASWTSATATGTALSINIATAPSIALAIKLNGDITAGSIAFEASMDSVSQSWFPVPLARVRDLIIEQTYALTNGNNSWQEGLSGFVRFRVRLIAAITGSGILYIALAGSAQASTPSATVGQAVGTNLHTWIDNSPAVSQLASSSPWVVGGTVTTQGTTDVQDRVARQIGLVGQALTSSPWVVAATLQFPTGTILPVVNVPVSATGLPLPFSQQVTTKVQVAGPCTVYGWHLLNTTAAIAYVQVFNKLVANVTLGTTVPDYVIPLPANSTTGAGATIEILLGIAHSTGMTIACTTTRTGLTTAAVDVLFFIR